MNYQIDIIVQKSFKTKANYFAMMMTVFQCWLCYSSRSIDQSGDLTSKHQNDKLGYISRALSITYPVFFFLPRCVNQLIKMFCSTMEKCDFTTLYPICIEWKHPNKVHPINKIKINTLAPIVFLYTNILHYHFSLPVHPIQKQDRNKVK